MNVCWNHLRRSVMARAFTIVFAAGFAAHLCWSAEDKKPPEPMPDVLVLSNGDTLHGKLVKAVGGKVTFHTQPLGDVDVAWDDIRELHTSESFGVLEKSVKLRGTKNAAQIPTGSLDVADQAITVRGNNAPAKPIPIKDAVFVVDSATLDKQIHHEPSFLAGWNGAATAGATMVQATQNQYTISGGISLVRTVPTLSWLDSRNRTQIDFLGSYGKITQPGTTSVKSSIYHADLERDQYLSSKVFALVQTAFDHNYAQDLDLQQIYGGGFGVTLVNNAKHEADVKGTIQYEKQTFISGAAGSNQNLIGSTFSADYVMHTKKFTYTQGLAFIPSYNVPRAYSAAETNTLVISAYKNFGLSVGTIDTYLNNPPDSVPPTKRNSFQFTMGLTYAIKSKY